MKRVEFGQITPFIAVPGTRRSLVDSSIVTGTQNRKKEKWTNHSVDMILSQSKETIKEQYSFPHTNLTLGLKRSCFRRANPDQPDSGFSAC